ncbi:MAG: YcxB family protein, partial [Phycisphaerae bacterium]
FVVFNNQKPATSSPPPATTPAAPVGNNIFVIVLLNLFPWVLIFIIIWFFFLRKISKDRHDQAAQIGFQTFDFTPELVTFTSSYCRNEYQWLAFTHFSESATIFLLYTSAITAHVIPKRAFATPADCDAFRQMALSKIQPPTKGFPVVMPEAFSAPTSKE